MCECVNVILNSSLRVAEMVWKEGVLIKDFPPEAFTIKCLDDSWALLKQDDGQKRFVTLNDQFSLKPRFIRFEEYLRQWMKKIQELLLESEQLRLYLIKNVSYVTRLFQT